MNKKSIIGTLVVVGLVVLVKWVIWPMIAVETMQATSGWNDAEGEIGVMYTTELAGLAQLIAVPADLQKGLTDCMTKKTIEFLNGTDCKYYYNKATTSEAEHEKEQTACLEKVGFEAKQEAIFVECSLAKIPNDWKLMEASMKREVAAEKGGACMVDALLKGYADAGCKLLNDKAANIDQLFNDGDECVSKNPEAKAKLDEAVAACAQ